MIESLTVTNYRGESLELNLKNPYETGYAVLYIDGLGPGKADINITNLSVGDGGLFNTARLSSRNISIGLSYLWGKESIEDMRHKAYRYFPIKRKVKLTIKTETRTAEIEGYVESHEPNIFSSSQGSIISIVCPNPYFKSTKESEWIYSGHYALFEFPFSNESLQEDLIEMGQIYYRNEYSFEYEGDAEVGMRIEIHALSQAIINPKIINLDTGEYIQINTRAFTNHDLGMTIQVGDDLVISTIQRNKYVRLLRNGVTYNILNCLFENPSWLTLRKGENRFAFVNVEPGAAEFKITADTLYEGM